MLENTKQKFVFIVAAVCVIGSLWLISVKPLTAAPLFPNAPLNGVVSEETVNDCAPTSSRPSNTPARTFIVNSPCDLPDNNLSDNQCLTTTGACTFRAALEQAAAWSGPNRIEFNVRDSGNGCPAQVVIVGNPTYYTMLAGSNQPSAFVVGSQTVIDGYTQCGASANSAPLNGDAVLRVQIQGNGTAGTAQTYHGVVFHGNSSEVRGLAVVNWGRGVDFHESSSNTFAGNFVGLNTAGQPFPNRSGIRINYNSASNIVGGIAVADRNIISGNLSDGLEIMGMNTTNNQVIGNYVGLKQDGSTAAGNGTDGIDVEDNATQNWVGGILLNNDALYPEVNADRMVTNATVDSNGQVQADVRRRNIVAGNGQNGVEISQKLGTKNNRIVGNWIGMDAFGNKVGNGLIGVTFEDRVNHNLVYLNVIVGSNAHGVRFYTVYENELFDNWIGMRPQGATRRDGVVLTAQAMPNGVTGYNKQGTQYFGKSGVEIMGGSNGNMIYHNVIAYNREYGIHSKALAGYLSQPLFGGYGSCFNSYNTFSQNSIFANAHPQGIRLQSALCDELSVGQIVYGVQNFDIAEPLILATSSNQIVRVKAGPSHTIEVFIVEPNPPYIAGEGKTFVGSGEADGNGEAVLLLNNIPDGAQITATTTDPLGNTSMFALNRTVTKIGCDIKPSSPVVGITRSQQNVTLNWGAVNSAEAYHIYRTTNATAAVTIADLYAVVNTNTFTDLAVLEDESEAHYVIRAVACGSESTNSNRVSAYRLTVTPGWNLLAWPFRPLNLQIETAVGNQLHGTGSPTTADRILLWEASTQTFQSHWYCAGQCSSWGQPWADHWLTDAYARSTASVNLDQGFFVQNRSGQAASIYIVGTEATSPRTQSIRPGWNLLGYSSGQARTLSQLNLPTTGTADPTTSNQILYWNRKTQQYETAWFCACPSWGDTYNNKWLSYDFKESPIVIEKGAGFWYFNQTNGAFTWTIS